MVVLKSKDIQNMDGKERGNRIKELKMELIKNKIDSSKGGKSKIREIKKAIAKLHTFNRLNRSAEK